MKVIHLGTKIVPEFGVLDDNGNVVQQLSLTAAENKIFQIANFSAQGFADAFTQLDKARLDVVKQVDKLNEQVTEIKEEKK